MSSELRDLSAHADVHDTDREVDRAAAETAIHPRAAGFRVLSRMARSRAEEDARYAPRHRLDAISSQESQVIEPQVPDAE